MNADFSMQASAGANWDSAEELPGKAEAAAAALLLLLETVHRDHAEVR